MRIVRATFVEIVPAIREDQWRQRGGGPMRDGERLLLRFTVPEGTPATATLVVMRRRPGGSWQVVLPTDKEDLEGGGLTLASLRYQALPQYTLEVSALGEGACTDRAVVIDGRWTVDWTAPEEKRWQWLHSALAACEDDPTATASYTVVARP